MKFALILDGVIDTISFEPQDAPWVEVADDVFAGFQRSGDGWAAPVAAPQPDPVPQVVTRLQARLGLIVYGEQIGRPGLLDEVDALVAGLQPGGALGLTAVQVLMIKEAWANAGEIRRESPALNLIFPALGLTLPEQLDALFRIAATQVV